jgi:hypothetical protein
MVGTVWQLVSAKLERARTDRSRGYVFMGLFLGLVGVRFGEFDPRIEKV